MKVLACTPKIEKNELYELMSPLESVNMRDCVDATLKVDSFCIFEEGEDFQKSKVLSIKSGDVVTVTNSKAFINEFEKIKTIFGEVKAIKVVGTITTSGYTNLTCRMGGL